MDIQTPTVEEIDAIGWNEFLNTIRTQFYIITVTQYRELLGRGITHKSDLNNRVTKLFKSRPIIGFAPGGQIIIKASGQFDIENMDMDIPWITNAWIATVTNTDVRIATADITAETITQTIRRTIKSFLGITTDDLSNIPKINFSHNRPDLTRGSWIYCDKNLNPTPIPEGGQWITGFNLPKSPNGSNYCEATDERGFPHTGHWDPKTGTVIYEAITAVDDGISPEVKPTIHI